MTSRAALLVAAAIALAAPRAALAQRDTLNLTLAEAIRVAKRQSPDLQKAQNTASAAGVAARAGWAGFLPSVSAGMNLTGFSSTKVTGEDNFGQPVELANPITFKSSSATQSVGLQLTLFDGLATLNNAHAAGAGRDAAVAGVDAQAVLLEANTKRAYFAAVLNDSLISVEEKLLQSARDQLEATQRRFRNAGADQIDVLGAQVALAQQEQAVARQRGAAEKALLTLRQTLGLGDTVAVTVQGGFPSLFDPSRLDADSLVARAETMSPAIEQSEATADQAHALASAAHGQRWPTIRGSVGYDRSVNRTNYGALTEFNPRNHGFSFGINVQLPIFSQFNISQRIAQANAQSDNADENLRAARLQLNRDVRSALIDLVNAYQQVTLADRAAELARQRLDLSRQKYQLGSITFTVLTQVVDQQSNAERQAVSARATFADALAQLEQQVGGPVTP